MLSNCTIHCHQEEDVFFFKSGSFLMVSLGVFLDTVLSGLLIRDQNLCLDFYIAAL